MLLSLLLFFRGEIPNVPVDMRPLPKEPEIDDRKKKISRSKNKMKDVKEKPNISYPTNFEHTVHVGFDAVTGEFTVLILWFINIFPALLISCFDLLQLISV